MVLGNALMYISLDRSFDCSNFRICSHLMDRIPVICTNHLLFSFNFANIFSSQSWAFFTEICYMFNYKCMTRHIYLFLLNFHNVLILRRSLSYTAKRLFWMRQMYQRPQLIISLFSLLTSLFLEHHLAMHSQGTFFFKWITQKNL